MSATIEPADFEIANGEVLPLPPELWEAIDVALAAAGAIDSPDAGTSRRAFAQAFVAALHGRRLILVRRALSKAKESVYVDIYALALDRQHAAERQLGTARRILLAGPGQTMILEDLHAGVAALSGRAPPADRIRIVDVAARLHQALEVLTGQPVAPATLHGFGTDFEAEPPAAAPTEA